MKFESDTEIDRLLRRHARRKATAASSAAENARSASDDESDALAGAGGVHMDADEMNAYAEGVVPEAARSRYMSHLANCDECRSLVTKLTLGANVAMASSAERTTDAASASRSWRDWLAALFAPPMLRYGVPALALAAVIVVALVAMRGQRKIDLVAQNDQRRASTVNSQINQDAQQAHPPSTGTADATVAETSSNANSGAAVSNPTQGNTAANTAPAPLQAKGGVPEMQSTPVPQNEPKPAEQSRDSGGLFGNTTADRSGSDEAVGLSKAQPPPPVTTVPAAKAPAEDKEATKQETEVTQRSVGGLGRNKTATPAPGTRSNNYEVDGVESRAQTEEKREAESGRRAGPAARRSRAGERQPSADAAGRDDKDDRAAETRSVGGRQFRRQGGAWVDTAYSPSRQTINVTRGSEQYRALTADEPGIRSIADQLGGTIILVWKSRAYKIY